MSDSVARILSLIHEPPKPGRMLAELRQEDPATWQLLRHLLVQWNVQMNMPGTINEALLNTEQLLNSGRMRFRVDIDPDEEIGLWIDMWVVNEYKPVAGVHA